jgi:hypothetical protein
MTEVMDEDVEVDEPPVTCTECRGVLSVDPIELHTYRSPDGWATRPYCSDCAPACASCGGHDVLDEMRTVGYTLLCNECSLGCDGCGEYFHEYDVEYVDYGRDEGYFCQSCRPHQADGSVRGYGHTRGFHWMKTDADRLKAKEDRYYLGIELEIGTDAYTGRYIMDWGARNLGHPEAVICKEDSSVEGFEIVFQPMTPEFFEQVNWEDFFEVVNDNHPCPTGFEESQGHGLHVHIGRRAFGKDDIMTAAYAYLLAQGEHLERIGRRPPTGYCNKVTKPVSAAVISSEKQSVQANRIRANGIYPGRDAINLGNEQTIEIRAFRSTRRADELRDAVRVTYAAAEYVRSLRKSKIGMSGRALHWGEFSKWVKDNYPEAYASISGSTK